MYSEVKLLRERLQYYVIEVKIKIYKSASYLLSEPKGYKDT